LTATGAGRNLRYGVRGHGMGAINNGLAAHGGLRPFCATFLVFSDYMRPSVRLAALMGLPVVYVWTHDSIGLGGDGPTHQPIEHLATLRLLPNLHVIRPADGPETAEAWRAALARTDGPTALALSRQELPAIDRTRYAGADGLHRGAHCWPRRPAGTRS
jgi:transketolase